MTFEESLARGQEGEHIVAGWLMRRGVTVLPLYQFKHHNEAPKLYRLGGRVTAPDLTCFGETAFFAEVKRKTRWTRHGSRVETGCDLRLWRDYVKIAKQTGIAVWMFFLHDSGERQGLYFGKTEELEPHLRAWNGLHDVTGGRVSKPLALFPIEALRRDPLP